MLMSWFFRSLKKEKHYKAVFSSYGGRSKAWLSSPAAGAISVIGIGGSSSSIFRLISIDLPPYAKLQLNISNLKF